MALPTTASSAASSAPDETGAQTSEEIKTDAQYAAELNDFLRGYRPARDDAKPDILQDRYRIDFAAPLPELNSSNAKAFAASDTLDPGRTLFAHVCEPGTVQRHRAITLLKTVNHGHILPLAAAGPVPLSRSGEERFVIFHERPRGKKLSELLAQNHSDITPNFLCERIIAPIASAINQFAEFDISHGLIHPDNIYFADYAVLGPCVAEPCGYAQPFYCEPLERMQAMPAGKGEGSTAHDYYALAAVALYTLFGPEHFADRTQETLARAILKEGVYNAMTRQKDMPAIFYDFFRGMLTQQGNDRWDYQHLKPWLDGKRYNVLPPPAPLEAIRPFEFHDAAASTRRELAHFFYGDWDKMAEPLRNNKLTQWVSVSLRNKDLAERVTRISHTVADMGSKNEMQLLEQLMLVLLLLDPQGPIRIKDLAFFIDGLDTLCAELYLQKRHKELQLLAKFIEMNMVNYWIDIQRKSQNPALSTQVNAMLVRMERLRTSIRYTGLGFGLERMLYELNPELPCLSPLLKGYHVQTLPALLVCLDKIAPIIGKDEELLDRHIAAFIANKLGIQHEIRLHSLANIPKLATNRAVLALHLLTLAQQKSGELELPGLTHWLALRILPALDVIHSRSLKRRVKSLLVEQAKTGYLELLSDVAVASNYASADAQSFQQARTLYHANEVRIAHYRKGSTIEQESVRYGFSIAKTFAYTALMLSLFMVLKGMGYV